MPAHGIFHLARRDPEARALEKIVAAALEPVVAVFVSAVDVARAHPAVSDRFRGLLGLVEVIRNRAAAAHVQISAPDALHLGASLVDQLDLVALDHDARAAGAIAVA